MLLTQLPQSKPGDEITIVNVPVDDSVIHAGQTVTIDHVQDMITITLRSLGGISAEALKDHLQKKWEVVETHNHHRANFIKSGLPDWM